MLTHPAFDPVAIQLGPIAIHWYGLMYLLGFAGAWGWLDRRGRSTHMPMAQAGVSDLLFYGAMGVILGGRLGYTLFYNVSGFLADPLTLFRIWEGGMSFHGGLLGVIAACWLFARRHRLGFFYVMDFGAPAVPIGLLAGRIGNFINGELWGKFTDLPWGMVFPHAGPEPRHPSMLYEAFLEGVVLFVILAWFSRRPRPRMTVSGLFLVLYALFRTAVEFVRVPDAHIGYLAGGWLTVGQLLTAPMFLTGAVMLAVAYAREARACLSGRQGGRREAQKA
ncbi:MAG: prolipoprotein diacylglyceryl transferase [Nevskiales bacterium]|nr:prolipoprotein diacylglyceryl transferase [Nevskiales bacterium]